MVASNKKNVSHFFIEAKLMKSKCYCFVILTKLKIRKERAGMKHLHAFVK